MAIVEVMGGERRMQIPRAFKEADFSPETTRWLESQFNRSELQLMFEIIYLIKPKSEGDERKWSRREIETAYANHLILQRGQTANIENINFATTLIVEALTYEGLLEDDKLRRVDWDRRLDVHDTFSFRQGPRPFIRVYQILKELGEKAQVDQDTVNNISKIIDLHQVGSST